MTTPYALGGLQSPPDERDYPAAQFIPASPIVLPPELDLRACLQPIRNQENEGTCGGFGLAGMMGYDEQTGAKFGRILSPRDAYAQARIIMPVPNGGGGSYPRALMAAGKQGICLETDRPYVAGTPTSPGPDAVIHRAQNQFGTYARLGDLTVERKLGITYHGAALASANVDDGFCYPQHGVIVPGGTLHGGHVFNLVGWSDSRGCWLVRNSWGTGWGEEGYAWLPYVYTLWEGWVGTPAFLDGKPVIPDAPWWTRMFGIHWPW